MSVRTRRRVQESEHSGPDERWMASYLAMLTVLMCMFIVLFAMSTVDQEKCEALSASLATGFGQEPSDDVDVTSGVVVPPELIDNEGEDFADTGLEAAEREFDELSALRERLRQVLAERGLETDVTFTIDERGLTIGLVSAETFFTTNSTDLSPPATQVLDAPGSVLVSAPNEISVEGHAARSRPSRPTGSSPPGVPPRCCAISWRRPACHRPTSSPWASATPVRWPPGAPRSSSPRTAAWTSSSSPTPARRCER